MAFLVGLFAPGIKCPAVLSLALLNTDLSGPHRGSCLRPSPQLAAVGNMPRFLRYLTTQLHQHVPRGLVLWYDSVVSSGQLKWQNELNEHNRWVCRAGRPAFWAEGAGALSVF